MPLGPGKYDGLATRVRKRAKAKGVILIVLDGEHGHGFAGQLTNVTAPAGLLATAAMLRTVANQIEADAWNMQANQSKD